jgi:hypothetical protein
LHDARSVISGISVSPRRQHVALYYQLYFDNVGQEEVCVFLLELLRHLRGPVIVLMDNSSTHQGKPLQHPAATRSSPAHRALSQDALELNPYEGVWSLAKRTLASGDQIEE